MSPYARIVKETYAIKWREPDGQTYLGRLSLGMRALVLDGRGSGESIVSRQIGYEEILGRPSGRLGAERLEGRPALAVERPDGTYLICDAGMGAPILRELADRLFDLRSAGPVATGLSHSRRNAAEKPQ